MFNCSKYRGFHNINGAGTENRTLLSTLGRSHINHYTIPARLAWSRCPGLNRRPTLYESAALPAELQRHSGSLLLYHPHDRKDTLARSCLGNGKLVLYESLHLQGPVVKLAYHASLSRRRSPVRIRSGPPNLENPPT